MTMAQVSSAPGTQRMLKDAAPIATMQQLLETEEVLDIMAAESMQNNEVFRTLESLSRAYVLNNMGSLVGYWPRNGGAIFDMITQQQEARLVAAEPQPALQL